MVHWLTGVFGFWMTYVLIGVLGVLLSNTIGVLYLYISGWLDRRFPDNLPVHAGGWVKEEIQKRGLSGVLRVIPLAGGAKSKVTDAFWPSAARITLKAETYFKKDPGFWAIAAHELGHALIHQRRILSLLFLLSRLGYKLLGGLGSTLLLVNLLYGSAEISAWALSLIRGGLWLFGVVLLEELLASGWALSMLRAEARLTRGQWWGACMALAAAFLTYLGELVGQVIVLAQSDFFVGYFATYKGFVAAPALSGFTWIVVLLLLVALVLRGLALLLNLSKQRPITPQLIGQEAATGALVMLLLWLVWDRSGTLEFIVAVMLAFLSARLFWGLLLSPVFMLLGFGVILLLTPLFVLLYFVARSLWSKTPSQAPVELNPAELAEGKRELLASQKELAQNPPWYTRLDPLRQAAFLPLCVLLLRLLFV